MEPAVAEAVGAALLSGALASLGSVFGKLAFESSASGLLPQAICRALAYSPARCPDAQSLAAEPNATAIAAAMALGRLLSFACVFVPNLYMWSLFTRSMTHLSSVTAGVLNSAANLLCTAMWGMLLFGDTLSLRWAVGAALITSGVTVIAAGELGREKVD
eukprot:c45859_g1_i1.p1 GENE.c45859_g1_i1~~c45859_g1_i1.p1  ORF type:complete len:185 (+),score=17.40 c45859_g1_i1:78-557(+)